MVSPGNGFYKTPGAGENEIRVAARLDQQQSARFLVETQAKERIIEFAVRRMLPKGPLGRKMARKLKVYAGPKHPHEAQQPQRLDLPSAARSR